MGGVVPGFGSALLDDVARQRADSRIEIRRELEVSRRLDRILQAVGAKRIRIRFGSVGIDFVSDSLLIVRPRLDSSLGIDTHERKLALHTDNPWRAKERQRIHGFEKEHLSSQSTDVFRGPNLKETIPVDFRFLPTLSRARFFPSRPSEFIEGHASPTKTARRDRAQIVDAHVHENFVVSFELADLSERHVVGKSDETGHPIAAAFERA